MLEHYQQHEEAIKVLENYAYDESFPPNPNSHVYLYRHLKKLNAPDKKLRRVLQVESTPRVSTSECRVFKIHPIPPCQYSRHHRGAAGLSSSTATIWPLSPKSSLRQTHNRLGHVLQSPIKSCRINAHRHLPFVPPPIPIKCISCWLWIITKNIVSCHC